MINDDGLILAIRRADNGHWEPPGGVLELGETIEAGVIREVHEETGITVEPQRLTGVYKNMKQGVIALVFRCVITSGSPEPTDEADEIAWLTPSEISERMAPAYAVRMLDALDELGPAIRAHDGRRLW